MLAISSEKNLTPKIHQTGTYFIAKWSDAYISTGSNPVEYEILAFTCFGLGFVAYFTADLIFIDAFANGQQRVHDTLLKVCGGCLLEV